MCPFWSWCFLKSMTKTDKKKALPLRPKQKKTWPFRPFPNENAPWIHPGDGFLKRGQAASTAEICFWWVGHLKRGGITMTQYSSPPWSDTNPSNPSIGLRKIETFRPAQKTHDRTTTVGPGKEMAQVYSIRFCSLEICEPCELMFPSLSALQSSRCIELSLGNKKIIPKCSGKVHLHTNIHYCMGGLKAMTFGWQCN